MAEFPAVKHILKNGSTISLRHAIGSDVPVAKEEGRRCKDIKFEDGSYADDIAMARFVAQSP